MVSENWRREKYGISDMLRTLGVDEMPAWITESNDGPWDYYIVRQSTHDGTLLFSYQLMAEAARNLAERTSFHKPRPPAEGQSVRYEVGPVRHATVFGRVDLPVGNYPGQRERIRIPVRAIYE